MDGLTKPTDWFQSYPWYVLWSGPPLFRILIRIQRGDAQTWNRTWVTTSKVNAPPSKPSILHRAYTISCFLYWTNPGKEVALERVKRGGRTEILGLALKWLIAHYLNMAVLEDKIQTRWIHYPPSKAPWYDRIRNLCRKTSWSSESTKWGKCVATSKQTT